MERLFNNRKTKSMPICTCFLHIEIFLTQWKCHIEAVYLALVAAVAAAAGLLRARGGYRRLRVRDFHTIGTWMWSFLQPYVLSTSTPEKYSWYSYLSGSDLTPAPLCACLLDYVNEKL